MTQGDVINVTESLNSQGVRQMKEDVNNQSQLKLFNSWSFDNSYIGFLYTKCLRGEQ